MVSNEHDTLIWLRDGFAFGPALRWRGSGLPCILPHGPQCFTCRMNLTLSDAFAKFGAKPANRLRALSAIAEDGAVVLSCARSYFGRPGRGVLRYEDKLSREAGDGQGTALLGRHLTLARDEDLPIRMIVASPKDAASGKVGRSFHVRTDLVGKVTKFDGDHFIVDFTRPPDPRIATPRRK